jgi:hypothetical protein
MLLWKALLRVGLAALGCLAARWYFTRWPPGARPGGARVVTEAPGAPGAGRQP